jgi:hypothetical protein
MCLKNIRQFYGLEGNGPISVCFLNNTIKLSQGVAYDKFMSTLATSPWFLERGKIVGREHIRYIPDKNIRFEADSRDSHAIGQDIFAAILDEINFAAGQDVSMEKSKIMKTYAAINTRITNRFRVEGYVHGKLFMVSSKKSEYDFLEQYAQKMKDQLNFYIVDDKVWNIVPPEKTGYSGKMFNLAIGGDILPSKIIPDNENVDDYVKQGYEIMKVPVEEKQKFVLDMERSLMDIAAVSISYVTKFLNYNIISQCYCDDVNPFSQEIISTGIKDALEIKDFFNLNMIPRNIRKKPTFIHIDTSLTGDRTGIGAVCMLGKDKIEKFDMQANKIMFLIKLKGLFIVHIPFPY